MEEIEYLKNKINEIKYSENKFKIMYGEDKYIFGIVSGKNKKSPFSKILEYKTLYDTLKDIDYKLKLSFLNAIEYAYLESLNTNFSVFKESSEEELIAYYYIENALFRTSTLWDLLAQFYRQYYNINVKSTEVYYYDIFNPKKTYCSKFKVEANNIYKYLNEKNNTNLDKEWKGNHRYVNKLRNKMIHRNSPCVAVMSDYDVNLKNHPAFMLKRIIEDYNVVSKFIINILNSIELEVTQDFNNETKI